MIKTPGGHLWRRSTSSLKRLRSPPRLVLTPVLAVPFADVAGRSIAWMRGVPGELARENAIRNPKWTATTAAALMIGVGLVGTIWIFAASAKASINKVIDDSFVGDIVINS